MLMHPAIRTEVSTTCVLSPLRLRVCNDRYATQRCRRRFLPYPARRFGTVVGCDYPAAQLNVRRVPRFARVYRCPRFQYPNTSLNSTLRVRIQRVQRLQAPYVTLMEVRLSRARCNSKNRIDDPSDAVVSG